MARSCLSLLVTNLRLLDFDRLPDWPDITEASFATSSKDHQNQKQRIRQAEWTLYRLFEIWDPSETRNKLQPFFPPFEPLQSINLRAALFRCLNELKKIGVLGRESSLRKTMLDECKGDRFVEILFFFSAAVLKRRLDDSEHPRLHASVARKISIAPGLRGPDEQERLIPLLIAHASSITTSLKKRTSETILYSEVNNLLHITSSDIAEKDRKYRDITNHTSSDRANGLAPEAITKQLQDNWVANQKWLDVLINGDEKQGDDDILSGSYTEFLRHIQTGDLPSKNKSKIGLVEDLETRIRSQGQRLRRWTAFQNMFKAGNGPSAVVNSKVKAKSPRRSLSAQFSEHEGLRPGQGNPLSLPKPSFHQVLDYRNVVDATLEELEAVKTREGRLRKPVTVKRVQPEPRKLVERTASSNESQVKIDRKFKMAQKPQSQSSQQKQSTGALQRSISSDEQIGYDTPLPVVGPNTSMSATPFVRSGNHSSTKDTMDMQNSSATIPDASTIVDNTPTLADQIIKSVADASPSPVKRAPRLSLADRTRLSMAAHNLGPGPLTSVTESPDPVAPEASLPDIRDDQADRRTTLLERTRQSMSLASTKPKPRQSMHKKRQSRQSLFPVNQFETPRKTNWSLEEEVPVEQEVTLEDADYDNIFKSRPKVAMSPAPSPSFVEDTSVTGGEEWESSPLRRFQNRNDT